MFYGAKKGVIPLAGTERQQPMTEYTLDCVWNYIYL